MFILWTTEFNEFKHNKDQGWKSGAIVIKVKNAQTTGNEKYPSKFNSDVEKLGQEERKWTYVELCCRKWSEEMKKILTLRILHIMTMIIIDFISGAF